jgi:hypothetical protein
VVELLVMHSFARIIHKVFFLIISRLESRPVIRNDIRSAMPVAKAKAKAGA